MLSKMLNKPKLMLFTLNALCNYVFWNLLNKSLFVCMTGRERKFIQRLFILIESVFVKLFCSITGGTGFVSVGLRADRSMFVSPESGLLWVNSDRWSRKLIDSRYVTPHDPSGGIYPSTPCKCPEGLD